MRSALPALSLLLLAIPAQSADPPHPALVDFQQRLAQQDYPMAVHKLNQVLRTDLSIEQKLPLWLAKADFYERYASDFERAVKELRKARKETAGIDAQATELLDERIAKSRAYLAQYWKDNVYVSEMTGAVSADERTARIDEMRQRLDDADERNPFRGGMAHCLALAYSDAGRNREAYGAFHRALQITPAIDLVHPTSSYRERALTRWTKETLGILVPTSTSILLALVVLGFFATRPHRWIRWPHLLALPVSAFAWLIAHRGLIALSAAWANVAPPADAKGFTIRSDVAAPLSAPLAEQLLLYGLAGIVLIYFASLALSRVRLPMTRYVAGASIAFFVMVALMLTFGAGQRRVTVVESPDARFEYLLGSYWYRTDDPLPYTLTDPQAYPGQSLEMVDEDRVRAFLDEMSYVEGDGGG